MSVVDIVSLVDLTRRRRQLDTSDDSGLADLSDVIRTSDYGAEVVIAMAV